MLKKLTILILGLVNVCAMVFPLTTEPYDHNKNLWTSEDTVTWGYPQAVLLDGGLPRFQGTPIAPQYLLTAEHLRYDMGTTPPHPGFSEVLFNGTVYQIDQKIEVPNAYDLMLVKIVGTFSTYAKLSATPPAVDDLILSFGSGWSAGPAIKDASGAITGWQTASTGKAQRWGLLKISDMNNVGNTSGTFFNWNWIQGISGVGSDNPSMTVGDSGGGMFDAVSQQLVSIIHFGGPVYNVNNQSSNSSGCVSGNLFSNTGLFVCGQSAQPSLHLQTQPYISWKDRNAVWNTVSPQILLNAGGSTTGDWTGWSVGYTASLGGTFDTSAVPNPAPQAVYSTVNYIYSNAPQSSLTYVATNLLRTESYKVRLHFSGSPFNQGECYQDVKINGAVIASNFDPSAAGINKASVIETTVTPNGSNTITIEILPHAGSAGHATVSGIEISIKNSSIKINAAANTSPIGSNYSVGDWLASFPNGIYLASLGGTFDTSSVSNPAPDAVYRNVIYGYAGSPSSLSYTFPNLRNTENYKVRLHFSGGPFSPGECIQDIKVNGLTVQSGFDPSGLGVNKASVVEVSPVRPNINKEIVLDIVPHAGSAGHTTVSGIEVIENP